MAHWRTLADALRRVRKRQVLGPTSRVSTPGRAECAERVDPSNTLGSPLVRVTRQLWQYARSMDVARTADAAVSDAGPDHTPRTALELVDRPFAFSQAPLLDADGLREAASLRGFDVPNGGVLEGFHRRPLLVPLYRLIRLLPPGSVPRGYPPAGIASINVTRLTAAELCAERDAGRLQLASGEPYMSWRRLTHRLAGGTYEASVFLYSRWQLLQLPHIRQLLRQEAVLRGRRSKTALAWSEIDQRAFEHATQRANELVVILGALEPHYLPFVVRLAHVPDDEDGYQRFEEAFDPVEVFTWLGVSAEVLQKQAETLLHEADALDPLRDWLSLVRKIGPSHWDELRGDARLAIDRRIAAEMILLFLEDLHASGTARALPVIPRRAAHPLRRRLADRDEDIDAVLTEFELSPHPALVLVVEGPTEMTVIPRAMAVLGVPHRDSHIRLVNRGGVKVSDKLLLPYVALPALGERLTQSMRLLRPVTRYLAVADAEGGYATAELRETLRAGLVRLLLNALPTKDAESERQVNDLVSIETWNAQGTTFEFAHFSDLQLARALIRLHAGPTPPRLQTLRADIRRQRTDHKPLKHVWSDWPDPKPAKPLLAEVLWPLLERMLRRAVRLSAVESVPIGRVIVHAERMARQFRRSRIVWAVEPESEPVSSNNMA